VRTCVFALLSREKKIFFVRTPFYSIFSKKGEFSVVFLTFSAVSDTLYNLTEHEAEILSLLDKNVSKSAIARKFSVCRKTVISFLKTSKTINNRKNACKN
jgi:DNA invertase Pin-like site-specific DNA recombinase